MFPTYDCRPVTLVKILVVEDYGPIRQFICAALRQRADFQIVEAADGLEGVQKAAELHPDLVLLDISLAKVHGFEAARRIRRLAPRARLIFLSQETSPEIVREAFRLGGRAYIQKLRTASDLLPAVDAVVNGRSFVSGNVAVPALPQSGPHRHEMVFCQDAASVVDVLTRFTAAALNAGDAAIALVTSPHCERIVQGLRRRRVDIDGAMRSGTFRWFAADEAQDPLDLIDAVSRARGAAVAAGKAHPRVACCGERAGRLWAEGRTAEAVALEQGCRWLPADVDVLCAYPRAVETDEDLAIIRAEHTCVSSAGPSGDVQSVSW
jgi:DNA-binding NarL/FixJ family response regulator